MPVLTPELRSWLQPGLAGMLATVDPSGQPETARIFGLRAWDDRDVLEVYLLRSCSEKVMQHLASGTRAAVNAIDVPTYRSRTFKGWCTLSRVEVRPDDARLQEGLRAMGHAFTLVGMPEDALARILAHAGPAEQTWVSALLEVDSVFDQSPKPGAGARL
jgi:hypothetical protein